MDKRELDRRIRTAGDHILIPRRSLKRPSIEWTMVLRASAAMAAVFAGALALGTQLNSWRNSGVAASPSARPSISLGPSPTAESAMPLARPTAPPLLFSYGSQIFSYRLDLPEGFRRSDCLSAVVDPRFRPSLGIDIFTLLSTQQERALTRSDVARGGPVAMWTFSVTAYQLGSSALELAERGGCPTCERAARPGEHVEQVTIGGREAARLTVGGEARLYVVRADDRLFTIELLAESFATGPRPTVLPVGILDGVARSFRVGDPRPVATPTPPAQTVAVGAREAGAAIVGALEAGDADGVAKLVTPRCWLDSWLPQAGPVGRAVDPYIADLRSRFNAGSLRVKVDPTVRIASEDGPGNLRLFLQSEWIDAGRAMRVDLFLREIDGRWYWAGVQQYGP